MTASKKAKTEHSNKKIEDDDAFVKVREYLLQCPHVDQDHPALQAALKGLEQERKRQERDAKLQRKFATGNNSSSNAVVINSDEVKEEKEEEKKQQPKQHHTDDEEEELMEWQDVQGEADDKARTEEAIDDSYLGRTLAKDVIASISEFQVRTKSPLAAIALALHAALRSLGFACTGIPHQSTSTSSGFAPPIRELPKTQFLPADWDKNQSVVLRYRKNGSVLLKVDRPDIGIDKVRVQLVPCSTDEPLSRSLVFDIRQHLNLDSWNAALRVDAAVLPALHYKGLTSLLTNFANAFDLGCISDNEQQVAYNHYLETIEIPGPENHFRPNILEPPIETSYHRDPSVPTTMQEAFPQARREGDFATDLHGPTLRFGRDGVGNLMGPNHPMFQQGIPNNNNPRFPMQPRFDPYYPPGIGGGRPRRGGGGDPNPDHLPPPNNLGSNMFL